MFKAKLPYERFMKEAREYNVPFKFFTKEANKILIYMHYIIGSASVPFLYWSEVSGDEETLKKVADELRHEGFKYVLSFEIPTP